MSNLIVNPRLEGLYKGYTQDVLKAGWSWQLLSERYTRQKEQHEVFFWFLKAVSSSIWLESRRMKEDEDIKFDRY